MGPAVQREEARARVRAVIGADRWDRRVAGERGAGAEANRWGPHGSRANACGRAAGAGAGPRRKEEGGTGLSVERAGRGEGSGPQGKNMPLGWADELGSAVTGPQVGEEKRRGREVG